MERMALFLHAISHIALSLQVQQRNGGNARHQADGLPEFQLFLECHAANAPHRNDLRHRHHREQHRSILACRQIQNDIGGRAFQKSAQAARNTETDIRPDGSLHQHHYQLQHQHTQHGGDHKLRPVQTGIVHLVLLLEHGSNTGDEKGEEGKESPFQGKAVIDLLEIQQNNGADQKDDAQNTPHRQGLAPHRNANRKGDHQGEGGDHTGQRHRAEAQCGESCETAHIDECAISETQQNSRYMEADAPEQTNNQKHQQRHPGLIDVVKIDTAAPGRKVFGTGRLSGRAGHI